LLGDMECAPLRGVAAKAGLGRGVGYVTVAFNNSTNLNDPPDPISLNVIKVTCPIYRGEIKAIKPDNPLAEKLTLRHSGDFAGKAEGRGMALSELLSEVLKRDIEIFEALKNGD